MESGQRQVDSGRAVVAQRRVDPLNVIIRRGDRGYTKSSVIHYLDIVLALRAYTTVLAD